MSCPRRCSVYSSVLFALLVAASRLAAAQDRDVADPQAATPDPQAAAPAQQPAKPPDGFKIGDFTFKPGGRVVLDVIRDFNPMNNVDSFDTRDIPIDAGDHVNTNLIAKETRLNIDIRGPAEGHELRMFVEGDFYGSSNTFRLRHAYGTWRGMLAGQTWSTFMDEDNIPPTIDFESPTAMAIVRQAQLRYTKKFGSFLWAAAIEDPQSEIVDPPGIPGSSQLPAPDFATRFRYTRPNGHIQLSAFTGAASFQPSGPNPDPTDADTDLDADTVALWGTALNINFTTWGRDSAYGALTYGPGIGRYRGGITAVPDEAGRLRAVVVQALMAGYEHFWTERWSSNAVYSIANVPFQSYFTSADNKELIYNAVNLLYWFLGPRGWMGVEYLWGKHEVFGPAPNSGTDNRLQYAVRFNLP